MDSSVKSIRLKDDFWEHLENQAAKEERKLNDYIRLLLKKGSKYKIKTKS